MKLALAAAAAGVALTAVSLALLAGFAYGAAPAAHGVRFAVQPPTAARGPSPAPIVSGVACALPIVQLRLAPDNVAPGEASLVSVDLVAGTGMIGSAPLAPCGGQITYIYDGLPIAAAGHHLVTGAPTAQLNTTGLPFGTYPIVVTVLFAPLNGPIVAVSSIATLEVFPSGPI